jgi:hypothetical protein
MKKAWEKGLVSIEGVLRSPKQSLNEDQDDQRILKQLGALLPLLGLAFKEDQGNAERNWQDVETCEVFGKTNS